MYVLKSGSLNLLEPSGPFQAYNRMLYIIPSNFDVLKVPTLIKNYSEQNESRYNLPTYIRYIHGPSAADKIMFLILSVVLTAITASGVCPSECSKTIKRILYQHLYGVTITSSNVQSNTTCQTAF